MTPHDQLRLLPWSGPDGKPCFLSTDNSNSLLSRLADTTEALLLDSAADLLDDASAILSAKETTSEDLRSLATDLARSLQDTLRVAESRGHHRWLQARTSLTQAPPSQPPTTVFD
ncbi:hypothetical protein [Streptomyces sp. NPDC090022]|uniref:hypothetical protein n=1 Tax=Streptomyces sp. NPDC090022 TaxID=3365920 RepID=UPI00380B2B6B